MLHEEEEEEEEEEEKGCVLVLLHRAAQYIGEASSDRVHRRNGIRHSLLA